MDILVIVSTLFGFVMGLVGSHYLDKKMDVVRSTLEKYFIRLHILPNIEKAIIR